MIPEKDKKHQQTLEKVKYISTICYSEEFKNLQLELEQIYSGCGLKQPFLRAFQDTLYAFIAQQEVDLPSQKNA